MPTRIASRRSLGGRYVDQVFSGGEGGETRAVNGKEREWGMCPEEREGRGSGASPVHLSDKRKQMAKSAGAFVDRKKELRQIPLTTPSIQHELRIFLLDRLLRVFDHLLVR
jgi:hypothetical protein